MSLWPCLCKRAVCQNELPGHICHNQRLWSAMRQRRHPLSSSFLPFLAVSLLLSTCRQTFYPTSQPFAIKDNTSLCCNCPKNFSTHFPIYLSPFFISPAMQQLFIDNNDQWEQILPELAHPIAQGTQHNSSKTVSHSCPLILQYTQGDRKPDHRVCVPSRVPHKQKSMSWIAKVSL